MHENCSIFTIIFSLFGRKKENPSTCWIFSVSFPQNLYGHQTMPKLSKKVSFGCPFIKKMEFFFMQKAFFWFFENRWDELALTSSAYNSLVFINISLISGFSILFWPMFWEMENQSSITCLKKYFWAFFWWALIWLNANKCSFKPFLSISTPKNGQKIFFS